MHISTAERKEAFAAALDDQLGRLAARGVRMVGCALSPIVLVKGDLDEAELAGGELLAGPDGVALRAALTAIGYAPEDFCGIAVRAGDSAAGADAVAPAGELIGPDVFREALETLDPEAVVLLDTTAADVMRDAYADALVVIEDFDVAMLSPGLVAHVLGRRVLSLDGFEAALADPREKQRMWAYLKQIPPAGAPY